MGRLSLTIYEPGHRAGVDHGWHWELSCDKIHPPSGRYDELLDCGTCRNAADAAEAADLAWGRAEIERKKARVADGG